MSQTQAEVAEALGVPQQTLSDWENGSNTDVGITFIPQPLDQRYTISRNQEQTIFERVQAGETRAGVAADYGITGQRVGQIVAKVEARNRPPQVVPVTPGDVEPSHSE